MPDRSDKWVDLIPHHRKDKRNIAERRLKERGISISNDILNAFEEGWNACLEEQDLYTIEDIKEIVS